MARSTAARRSALTFGEPRSTSETRDLETPARSATSRMVGRAAEVLGGPGCPALAAIQTSVVAFVPYWNDLLRVSVAYRRPGAPAGREPTRFPAREPAGKEPRVPPPTQEGRR